MLAALLIAHGSRRPEANADLVALAEAVRAAGRFAIVEIAYLELAEPDIPAGAARCVELGATEVRMLPYFLSTGRHVAEDLDGFRRDFATRYPGVTFTLCPPLGLHPKVVEVVLERLGETAG
ncbi:MAG TPA: CbiX/SirB N-terminal domain-containing protein [Planctomycetaceae bacterium]